MSHARCVHFAGEFYVFTCGLNKFICDYLSCKFVAYFHPWTSISTCVNKTWHMAIFMWKRNTHSRFDWLFSHLGQWSLKYDALPPSLASVLHIKGSVVKLALIHIMTHYVFWNDINSVTQLQFVWKLGDGWKRIVLWFKICNAIYVSGKTDVT